MLLFDIEADDYLEDATRIWCIVAYDDEAEKWYEFGPDRIQEGVDLVSNASVCAAHNGLGFDAPLVEKLHGARIDRDRLVDTLVVSRLAFPDIAGVSFLDPASGKRRYEQHSIEAWGRRLDVRKGDFTSFDRWDPAMLDYCKQDIRVMAAFLDHVRKVAPWALSERCFFVERKFAANIQDMMDRGAHYDSEAAEKMAMDVSASRALLEARLSGLHPGWQDPKVKKRKIVPFNPGSRQQIVSYFKEKYDWKPVVMTDSGQPRLDEDVLDRLPYEEARDFAELFRLQKLEASLLTGDKSWSKSVKDGRIHGFVCHNGTPTGRCRHSSPNLGNIPRRGAWIKCRELFTAPEGKLLVGADASSLELVILAHYLSHWDDGEYISVVTSQDIHSYNQKAAGLPTRDQAKTLIYALIYGAGDRKLGTIVSNSQDDRELAAHGRDLRARFLDSIPAYGKLLDAVTMRAKTEKCLIGLDGRRIPIRSSHSALNFLLQGGGAVTMKEATNLACKEVGGVASLVLHVHDEMQFETDEDKAQLVGETVAKCITQAAVNLGVRCPLGAEFKIGKSWKDTH